jgi:hypothetical protein
VPFAARLLAAEVARRLLDRCAQLLAVTDHNTVSQHLELDAAAAHADIILLRDQELTTDRGHANCLGGDVLLRHEGDLLVRDADGALLIGPEGAARPVRGRRVRVPGPGPHRIVDGEGQTLALSP